MSFATFFATTLLTARVIAGVRWSGWSSPARIRPTCPWPFWRPAQGTVLSSIRSTCSCRVTAFVGFTTALFFAALHATEQDHGRVNAARLRLDHSMYQLFTFTMLLCCLSNNVGVMWVAMEGATLSTVLLVSLYRNAGELEAA